MAACTTLEPMAYGSKVVNLRAYMMNLANSRGFSLPETNLFEQKFLDLCPSNTPDHPTYSAMIYMAIMELNKEDGACEEAISVFIKSKYKNLPYAHTSLLSHHLAKLVEKREIFCDCNNYCYSLAGEKNTVETLMIGGVAEEPRVELENKEAGDRTEANNEVGEVYELVVQDEQNDVLMEASGNEVMEKISKQREAKLRRTSNTMKESSVEVKKEAYKRLSECQNEACNNIIALEKMLKHCRVKDQRNKAVSETDYVSRLPLSMESCKELRKVAQKIQSQLSEIIDSCDEVVPYSESRRCEIKGTRKELCKEGPNMITPYGNNGFEETSKQLKQKKRKIDSQKKPQVNKTRIKRPRDIVTTAVRKPPRFRLCNS